MKGPPSNSVRSLQRAELGTDTDGHDSSTAQRKEERGQCGLLGLEAIDEEGQRD